MEQMTWVKGARVLLDDSLRIRAGEKVLIVGDTTTVKIVEFLACLAAERDAEVTTCFMKPTGRHAAPLPDTIAAAMKAADVVILPTAYSAAHTDARRDANAAGARIAIIPGADGELFSGGSLEVDLFRIAQLVAKVGRRLSEARTARVTSASGTDLHLQLAGRASVDQTGVCHEPGTWGVLPDIETAVGPLEGSAEGVWMVDGCVSQLGGVVQEPIKVTISGGRVVDIEGGKDAANLRALLESYGDPSVYFVVEMGIGLNPKAKMERSYLESESEYGSMHIGIGDGTSFGVSHRAPAHVDLIVRSPTLELDGVTILRDRVLVLDEVKQGA